MNKNYMVVNLQSDFMYSLWEKILLISMIIMAIVSFLCILCRILQYVYFRKLTKRCRQLPLTKHEENLLDKLKCEMHLTKEITLIKSLDITTPFTIGIIRPLVAIPMDLPVTKQAFQMTLRHELVHIKHHDALLNLIACFILSIHWFNPLCYLFLLILKEANELYCDEETTSLMKQNEKRTYCLLLIELSKRSKLKKDLFAFKFIGDSQKQIKRRIKNIMNTKNGNFRTPVLLGYILINLGIFSSFIHVDAGQLYIKGEEDYLFEYEESFYTKPINSTSNTTLLDEYFTDDNGSVYPKSIHVNLISNTSTSCNHNYVNGTRTVHQKDENGCTEYYHRAKRCSKCETIVNYDFYNKVTWKVCPHK